MKPPPTSPAQPVSLPHLRDLLVDGGLISKRERLKLAPYAPRFPRRPADQHWHYRIDANQRPLCHLVVGQNVAKIQSHAREFHEACPELICPPLLQARNSGGLEYLCLEHFSGRSLDELVQAGHCTARQWTEAVQQAQAMLENTAQETNATRLQQEVQALVDQVCGLPGIAPTDAMILRELIQPAILEAARTEPLTRRWSNRDFVGRNLLLNEQGGIKLIDYEDAAPTHFGHSDRLRLMHFSVLPAGLKNPGEATATWHEIPLWLQHLVQLQKVRPSDEVRVHISDTVARLFAAVNKVTPRRAVGGRGSFFVHHLAEQQSRADALLLERTGWAQSLEKELKASRQDFEKLTGEYQARTAWAKKLGTELQEARADHLEQSKLAAERSAWGQSLEAELATARECLAALTKEHTERTRWARSLEWELGNARGALAELTGLLENRTTWAQSLEQQLQATQAEFAALAKDHGERAKWMETLTADLRLELAAQTAEANKAAGAALDNQMRAEVAESEARRLGRTMATAHVHVEHLLGVVRKLQQVVNVGAAEKIEGESILRQKAQALESLANRLQYTQKKLADYESQLFCRLVVRASTVLARVASLS